MTFAGVKSRWLFAANYKVEHWSIVLYAPVFLGLTAAFVSARWAMSNNDGLQHIRVGLWVLVALRGAHVHCLLG